MIAFAPTGGHKTTGLAIPALLEWQGPVLATSVKSDLLIDTVARRRIARRGDGLRPGPGHRDGALAGDAALGRRDLARSDARRPLAGWPPHGPARADCRTPTSGTRRRRSCWRRCSSPPPPAGARWRRSSAGSTKDRMPATPRSRTCCTRRASRRRGAPGGRPRTARSASAAPSTRPRR